MTARILTAALLSAVLATPAGAADLAYSATSGRTCMTIRAKPEFTSWRCPGPGGYSVVFHDLGNLVAVELGPTGGEKALVEDDLMWQGATQPFGKRLEWRLIDGKPYAAILRIRHQAFDRKSNDALTVEELNVIKVSPQGACLVGSVSARQSDANVRAREMADAMAPTFRCGADRPRGSSPDVGHPD
jgi:hypothetical protein